MKKRYILLAIIIVLIVFLLILGGVTRKTSPKNTINSTNSNEINDGQRDVEKSVDIRQSAVVRFAFDSNEDVKSFVENPKKSYIQSYVLFPEDLASDVMFGIDQEFEEGVNDPIRFEGAAWMAFVTLTRDGRLGFPVGSNNGKADSANNWELINLNISFDPNVWYFMRTEVDFENNKFDSFYVKGNGVDEKVDISEYYLSYPHYTPFDRRTLTYYAFSIRVDKAKEPGSATVYFDDLETGIYNGEDWVTVFKEDYENQEGILVGSDVRSKGIIPLGFIDQSRWYFENKNSIAELSKDVSRSGEYSLKTDSRTII